LSKKYYSIGSKSGKINPAANQATVLYCNVFVLSYRGRMVREGKEEIDEVSKEGKRGEVKDTKR